MKLKNSYILLITIAVFLLVSIGSVSANDIDTNEDVSLSDDGSDIVLANESANTTVKKSTEVVSEDVAIRDNETKVIDVTVKDNESNSIGITDKNLTVYEGNKQIKFSYNNSKIIILDKLSKGNHKLNITYLGNDIYNNSSKIINLCIFGNYSIETDSSIDVNSSKIVEIPINVTNGKDSEILSKNEFNISITYKDGNETKTVNISDFKVENNKIIFNYPLANNITTSNIAIVYTNGNKTLNTTIKSNRIYNVKIDVINGKNQYQNGNFTFKVTDIDNETTNLTGKKIRLTIIRSNLRTSFDGVIDKNGIITFKTTSLIVYTLDNGKLSQDYLNVGNNTVELSKDEKSDLRFSTFKTNLTIEQATINIEIENMKEEYGTAKKFNIEVTNAVDGSPVPGILLHLYMPETKDKHYYILTNVNGTGVININTLTSGIYNINVSNNDTKNMKYKQVSGKITIVAKPVTIAITSGSTISYNTGTTAIIKITDKKTGKAVPNAIVYVQIYTGSKSKAYLFQADKNGFVKFSASLAVGKHKIVVKSADTRYSSNTVTKYITVKKASAKIVAPKVTAYYKQGKYFTIKLVNTQKKNAPIYDGKLNIRIYISPYKYYNYNGNTGGNGQLKLLIDLNPGTYKVEVRGADAKDFSVKKVSSKIVVLKAPTKLTPAKITAKKGTNKNFKVTVKNTKTNKVIPGVKVKVKVYTGKSYKTYTIKTNSKGIAYLNVKSLSVGNHKVVVSSANKYCVGKTATSYIKITK
ncbi:hypothetical protein [Methanobrevibacter sp.]|uniref:hypothetical protein n=1 Tax=Methanobrevibacter sp. TaxID=66852 RepID=UPI0026E0EB05|nr:hypothetical protein [Methanobrevibacter sp.]MDO5823911.1 hypothetical protein [Methanobrevibacter sp.]